MEAAMFEPLRNRTYRHSFLAQVIALDLVRAAIAICLPFVDQIWQIYALIFILQAASAAFTPTLQATIPDILPDEKDYTKALSLSRLAYDMETLLSPVLAAALLSVMSFHNLFAGRALGFLLSLTFVLSVVLPQPQSSQMRSFMHRLRNGVRILWRHRVCWATGA
ncbi:MAG: MFS transporter [Hyphomicrobiales bacterium]|nr:MFS transporter [Hyphomicrobiales bacterium]